MEKEIIFVAEDQSQADQLCRILQAHHFGVQHLQSLQMAESLTENKFTKAILIDLDSMAISNIDIRNLKRAHPDIPLLSISRKPFHPDLQESMRSYIFACVSKPIDPDELIFLLNIALENGASSINTKKEEG